VNCCQPHLHVEAADPKDLTFSKIAEEMEGFAFQFKVWSHVVNLDNMDKIDVSKRKTAELAARTLERILERVEKLVNVCGAATPRDLKVMALPEIEEDGGEYESSGDEYEDDSGDEGTVNGLTAGFIIQSHLDGIRILMQTLAGVTRSLQEATPDAKEEVMAVGTLVADVDRYFGSPDALDLYSINPKFAGREALDEARYNARHIR